MSPLTTSGKQQLIIWQPAGTAAATRIEKSDCKTAVALNPPSATSRLQALPVAAMTLGVWVDAAWTTTLGLGQVGWAGGEARRGAENSGA